MEEAQLRDITLGSYQLKQAKSYAHEHKKAKVDEFEVEFVCYVCDDGVTRRAFADIIAEKNIESPVLVYTQLASRFRSKKSYDSYILADANKDGPEGIIGYFCKCRHGLRTIGCCSHIATTIYFLCYARHHGGIRPVAGHVDNFFQHYSFENGSEDEEYDDE